MSSQQGTSLQGKTALVTGVTSGIGRALVDELVQAGATVIGVARNRDRLQQVVESCAIQPILADLADEGDVAQCIARVCETCAGLDILVNNAAECVYERPTSLAAASWRRLMDVNVNALVQLCAGLAGHLRPGADIINMSSVTADFVPGARFGPYAVTKTAVKSFTDVLRLELAPSGARVTLIAPGLVDTEIYTKVSGFEKTLARLKQDVPDWLLPEDVARAVMWALQQPAHVVVGELTLYPRGQTR